MLPASEIIETPASVLRTWFLARDPAVQLHLALAAQSLFVSANLGEKLIDLDKALLALGTSPMNPEAEARTSAFIKAFSEALEPLSTPEQWRDLDSARPAGATEAQEDSVRKSVEKMQRNFIDAATSFSSVVASCSYRGLRVA